MKPAPTEKGLSVEGVGEMDFRSRLHGAGSAREKRRWGMGPRIREDNGRGRAVRVPAPTSESPDKS